MPETAPEIKPSPDTSTEDLFDSFRAKTQRFVDRMNRISLRAHMGF